MNVYPDQGRQSMVHVHVYSLAVNPSQNHSHLAMGITGPSIAVAGGHVHQVVGYVSYQPNHFHSYSLQTGLAMPVEGATGKHVHYFLGETSFDAGHTHRMESYTMPL